jgi:hypothetical protein
LAGRETGAFCGFAALVWLAPEGFVRTDPDRPLPGTWCVCREASGQHGSRPAGYASGQKNGLIRHKAETSAHGRTTSDREGACAATAADKTT